MKPEMPGPTPLQSRLLRLNRRQTNTLITGAFLMLIVTLYPPWVHTYGNEMGRRRDVPAGFHSLMMPPEVNNNAMWRGAVIDWTLLMVEWAVTMAVVGVFIYSFRDKNPEVQRLLRHYDAS